jgi:protein-S-isoprenylcysteine O-methyltransferase Ste14
MDLYSKKSEGKTPQLIWLVAQLVFLGISYWVLFPGRDVAKGYAGFLENSSRVTLYLFNVITFIRFIFTLFVFIKRRIPLEESISVIFAFALYFVGFSVFLVQGAIVPPIGVITGIALFLVGSYFNTFSEYQRMQWKKDKANSGHVYVDGLFKYSRHPNYFGDCLWVLGYAVVTGNPWSFIVPALLFAFFLFYNIPIQEMHMNEKYGEEYEAYGRKVKKLIPYIV